MHYKPLEPDSIYTQVKQDSIDILKHRLDAQGKTQDSIDQLVGPDSIQWTRHTRFDGPILKTRFDGPTN